MVINAKRAVGFLVLLALIIAGIFGVRWAIDRFYQSNYPRGYEEFVTQYAKEFGIDRDIVYAVIKTESDFRPGVTSNVGARGLMQVMEDTFNWIKTKLRDSGATYDDMYDPAHNIRYGAFFLAYLYDEFGSYDVAVAAYHAGRTATANWLADERYSGDGRTLHTIPSDDTEHYVGKVMDCYEKYKRIYGEQGEPG